MKREVSIEMSAVLACLMALLAPLASGQQQKGTLMDPKERFLDAIKKGDVEKVTGMLKDDPSLSATTDESGVSALLVAAYHRKAQVVRLLLEKKAELNLFEAAATG